MVGSASISAFPLFGGFVSKSLIPAATTDQGHLAAWLILLSASAGVLDHSGIEMPFFTFFFRDSGLKEAGLPALTRACIRICGPLDHKARGVVLRSLRRAVDQIYRHYGPAGALARSVSAGNMVFWVLPMLAGYLVIALSVAPTPPSSGQVRPKCLPAAGSGRWSTAPAG